MNQNTSLRRHLQSLLEVARGLWPNTMDTVSDRRSALITMEPYMDTLPTRRPLPRTARTLRVQSVMQMSIDA